ncbi:hypothetical protein N7481_007855 [Penicillium waksmanii]|uniref:uncharacterized protein n=1 Tax=Penicillium waksmanii TaxID=69791 RepID=UPI002547D624|nr:uncharacterized protein N7481_007855 [Penicillium waksmanii]KAJ5980557.1 hypothetical protein N7481_007855 [Penicillium waksmanii]
MKYNIPTLMALYQDTEVTCNWTGHVKDCKLLRPGHPQKPATRVTPRKKLASKTSAGPHLVQSLGHTPKLHTPKLHTPKLHTPKPHNRSTANKRKISPKPLTTTDAGFARFLKEHSSPKNQRVTAGGRIVPMITGEDSIQVERDSEEWKPPQAKHSTCYQSSPTRIIDSNYIRGGAAVVKSSASFVLDPVQNDSVFHQIPITTAPAPVIIPMPVQSFLPPVFPQQSMSVYQGANASQQMDENYFPPLDVNSDLNFHSAGIFRSKLEQVQNIVNGVEDANFIDFKADLRLILDLVGRPMDSLQVEYLIYLHEQLEMALGAASRHLQSVDAEIAMCSASSPSHVGLRIKWKRIRAEVFDRLEEIKLGLGEALDQFNGIQSITSSIIQTLCPGDIRLEPLSISSAPDTPYQSMPQIEEFQADNTLQGCIINQDCEPMKRDPSNSPDFESAFDPQLPEPSEAIEHPGPQRAGRFDDVGSDLYGDGDTNRSDASSGVLDAGDEQNIESSSDSNDPAHNASNSSVILQDSAGEDDSVSLTGPACSQVSQNGAGVADALHESRPSGQTDGVAEIRIPRYLPRNLRRRDSHTLPRNFPRRFSSTSPFAAEQRPSSRYFPWNWRTTMGSGSGSDSVSSIDHEYDEGSQHEDCVSDMKPIIRRRYGYSEDGPAALTNQPGGFDLSSDYGSNQSNPPTQDDDYDADIDLTQDSPRQAVRAAHQNEQTKAIRAELRAMQGIGQHRLPIGRPTIETFATTAVGLPGRFQYGPGWMALALKKLFP